MNGLAVISRSVMMHWTPSKNCGHCRNGHYRSWPGTLYDPPEEDFRCDKEDVLPEDHFKNGDMDTWPTICGHFKPHLVEKCGVCGQEMNVPEYLWPLMAPVYPYGDNLPVCSTPCYVRAQATAENEQRDDEDSMRRKSW